MATYKLTLRNLNNSGENSSVTLTYDAQGTAAKIKVDAKEVTCTLSEFNYSKEIYCPGKIWFRLQLGSTFDPSVIYKLFSSCTVQLSVGTFPVAENYRVFNIQLERKLKSSDVYVIVEAFSPDKFLTLDTYCKAYTGKKLVKEIIQNKEYWPDNVGSDLSQLVDVHPQFLEFAVTKTEETEDPNTHKKKTQQVTTRYEFIQPYLVQYNESFFDFLVRVTNRCGEFFYYEGGKIHVGWPRPDKDVSALTDNDLVHIDTYTSIRYMQRQTTAWNAASLADVHNDYTQAKTWMTTASPKMMRDSELAYDEHLAALPPKDKYTKWEDYAGWPEAFWISTVSDVFNQANLKDMIAYIMWDAPVALGTSKMSADSSNDDYEQTYFKKEAKEEEHHDGPEHSQLLADNRQDHIVLHLRDKLLLGTVSQPLSKEAAGAHRVEPLHHLVADTGGVPLRIQPHEQSSQAEVPGKIPRLHERPQDHGYKEHRRHPRHNGHNEHGFLRMDDKDHQKRNAKHDDGCT